MEKSRLLSRGLGAAFLSAALALSMMPIVGIQSALADEPVERPQTTGGDVLLEGSSVVKVEALTPDTAVPDGAQDGKTNSDEKSDSGIQAYAETAETNVFTVRIPNSTGFLDFGTRGGWTFEKVKDTWEGKEYRITAPADIEKIGFDVTGRVLDKNNHIYIYQWSPSNFAVFDFYMKTIPGATMVGFNVYVEGGGELTSFSGMPVVLATSEQAITLSPICSYDTDLSNYYKKSETLTTSQIKGLNDLSNYYNKEQIKAINTLNNYYQKSETYKKSETYSRNEITGINNLTNYTNNTALNTRFGQYTTTADLQSGYYTKSAVDDALANYVPKGDFGVIRYEGLDDASTGEPLPTSYIKGATLTLPDPKQGGREFAGWTWAEGQGEPVRGDISEPFSAGGVVTLTANWNEVVPEANWFFPNGDALDSADAGEQVSVIKVEVSKTPATLSGVNFSNNGANAILADGKWDGLVFWVDNTEESSSTPKEGWAATGASPAIRDSITLARFAENSYGLYVGVKVPAGSVDPAKIVKSYADDSYVASLVTLNYTL